MAGELARATMDIAARSAVRQARALRRISDSWSNGELLQPEIEESIARLEAGDRAAVSAALPGLMAQIVQLQQQQQGAPE